MRTPFTHVGLSVATLLLLRPPPARAARSHLGYRHASLMSAEDIASIWAAERHAWRTAHRSLVNATRDFGQADGAYNKKSHTVTHIHNQKHILGGVLDKLHDIAVEADRKASWNVLSPRGYRLEDLHIRLVGCTAGPHLHRPATHRPTHRLQPAHPCTRPAHAPLASPSSRRRLCLADAWSSSVTRAPPRPPS